MTALARARSRPGSRARRAARDDPGPLPRLRGGRRRRHAARRAARRRRRSAGGPRGAGRAGGGGTRVANRAGEPARDRRDPRHDPRRVRAAAARLAFDPRADRRRGPARAGARASAGGVPAAGPRRGADPRRRSRAGALPRGRSRRRHRRGVRRRARAGGPARRSRRLLAAAGRARVRQGGSRSPAAAGARDAVLLEGAPLHGVDVETELVTPTGATLVAALAEGYGPLPTMTLETAGYGAGTRDGPELPNVVRAIVGTATGSASRPVSVIEANLDDLLPELAPDAAAACFAAGALDVWTAPAQMKHGRPGFVLSALTRPDDERAVATAMLRETSTLGVRIARLDRIELERESRTVEVAGEPVRVKVGRLDGRVVNLAPEHADCERAARISGAPVKTVWAQALAAAHGEDA